VAKLDFVHHYLDDGVPERGRLGRFYVCRLQVGGHKNAALLWQYVSGRFLPLRGLPHDALSAKGFYRPHGRWWLHNPREEWARLAGLTADEYDSAISRLKKVAWFASKTWLYEGQRRVWITVDWHHVPVVSSSEYEQFESLRKTSLRVIGGSHSGNKEPTKKQLAKAVKGFNPGAH